MRLADLAARIEGTVEGDGSVDVVRGQSLEDAGPGSLTYLGDPKYASKARATKAGGILLGREAEALAIPAIRVDEPSVAFARALEILHPMPRPVPGVHPTAVVARSARLGARSIVEACAVIEDDVVVGERAWVGPHVVLSRGAAIGDDFRAHAHAFVGANCRLGHRVILQPGAVIGADGFGFAQRRDRSYHKIPHVGVVVLEDDVEVQANSCVDRASLGVTRLARGVKVDNLVQIAHNVTVGEDTVLCGQVGIAGSSTIGKRCTLTGQVGVVDHVTVGDDVAAFAQTGLMVDVEGGHVYAGTPPMDSKGWWRSQVALRKLPDLAKEVRDLRRRLEALEAKASATAGAKSP